MSRPIRSRLLLAAVPALAVGLGLTAAPPAVAAAPVDAVQYAHRAAEPVALPTGFRPEGVTSGPGDTYYTSSLADGRIWTGDLSRGTGRELVAGVTGRALRGMQYDHRSGLLWVTGQDGTTGIVLVVKARTGKVLERIEVPGAVFLNDLVLTKKAVWVTDSKVDRLTRISLGEHRLPTGAPRFAPLGTDWPVPDPVGNRANGIRELQDGSLVLDHSTAGGLWRFAPRSGKLSSIPVSGGTLTGGDGLERRGKTLYVVRGSGQQEVSVLTLKHGKKHGKKGWSAHWKGVLTSPDLDVPATATLVGKTLWAVNARFGVADPAAAGYQVVPLPTRR